jgi:hypothetical protein
MTSEEYLFDNDWKMTRERLAALERDRDYATIRCLEAISVAARWRCLEIGGGGGSIAAWLCERVGSMGSVLATDTNTRFLAALDYHGWKCGPTTLSPILCLLQSLTSYTRA